MVSAQMLVPKTVSGEVLVSKIVFHTSFENCFLGVDRHKLDGLEFRQPLVDHRQLTEENIQHRFDFWNSLKIELGLRSEISESTTIPEIGLGQKYG